MKRQIKSVLQYVWMLDGARRLRAAVSQGNVDEEAVAELWLAWGNPHWSATTEMLDTIAVLAMRPSTRVVLECGSGISTVVLGIIAEATGARVISLEADGAWVERMAKLLERLRIRSVELRHAPLVHGDSADWYDRAALGDVAKVDLFLCDGPPGDTRGGRAGALGPVLPLLSPHAVIVVDDVHRAPELELATRFAQHRETSLDRWGRPNRQFAVIERPAIDT